jgi:hypothetical protein
VALAPAAIADGLNPGSVLVYPIHRSNTFDTGYFTVVCVTNTNLNPVAGGTNVHYEYVNVVPDLGPNANPHKPLHCNVVDRIEALTPADTKCVLTSCHNASSGEEGYLVVSAQDPNQFNVPWSFNHLIGSELAINGSLVYSLNAIPFKAIAGEGELTDADQDGQLDFDEVEYEGIPNTLFMDSFIAEAQSSLILINMTGGFKHVANVAFDVWNDNEFPLSATLAFKCWTEGYLTDVSLVFDGTFLGNNTPNDKRELDTDCDGYDDFETGWARIRGLNASSDTESIPDPALLGAVAEGVFGIGGRRLWESEDKQLNGDFFKTGSEDPEANE